MEPTTLSADDRAYVFAVIRRVLRCEDAASDATQDALLLAHRHRASFRGDAAFRTWLYRIAITTAIGHLRRRRRSREDLAIHATIDEPADHAPPPDRVVAHRQLADHARRCLATVEPGHRAVFLRGLVGFTEREIANDLGISRANVKIRAHRVRLRLRELLHGTVDAELARSA